jgi:hypothetical protein
VMARPRPLSFPHLLSWTEGLSPNERLRLFLRLPERVQREAWAALMARLELQGKGLL